MSIFSGSAPSIGRDYLALALRVGLGIVFVIGGWFKLSRLLDSATHDAIVGQYVSPLGYINRFFIDYLFSGNLPNFVTPASFLIGLSAFELVSGLMLIAGLAVRPLALLYGFLLWTFVIALPVTTSPGVVTDDPTYTSPAALVQIRDIALSGMMFVLFNLGPGAYAADRIGAGSAPDAVTGGRWDALGLLLRLSVASVFIVAGAFNGFHKIPTFDSSSWVLLPIGLALAAGIGVRLAAAAAVAVLVWYMVGRLDFDASLIVNLNAIKREFALVAAGGILAFSGGGRLFTATAAWRSARDGLPSARRLLGRPHRADGGGRPAHG